MTTRYEIDFENERILLDGAWLNGEEISSRLTHAIAAKNFAGVGRLGDALEQLSTALSATKTLTLKLSGDHFARIEAAGQKLGKTPAAFARDLLVQVLSGAPAAPAPAAFAPPPEVSPEEAAAALTLTPKRRDVSTPPPVVGAAPSVVVDLGEAPAPQDPQRWFTR